MSEATASTPLVVNEPATGFISPAPSGPVRVIKNIGWFLVALFFLTFFTLLKLPEDKIKNYIQGTISSALASQGMTFSAEKGYISVGLGLSYTMTDVTISSSSPEVTIKIDQMKVSPSIIRSILSRGAAGSARIESKYGRIDASFSSNGSDFSTSFDAQNLDVGKLGILSAFAGVRAGAIINASGSLRGDMNNMTTLVGEINADLKRITIDQQTIQGFAIPQINISEGKLNVVMDKSKATVRTLSLGKQGNPADDLRGTITGDITLARRFDNSSLNLKARFNLSETVLKSIPLLDAILMGGKQPDGSYAFHLTGTFNSMNPVPLGAGS